MKQVGAPQQISISIGTGDRMRSGRRRPARWPPWRGPLLRRFRPIPTGLAVAGLAWAIWRLPAGARLSDDGHVVALAVRMARGDQPFVHEMNVQALGSIWAVPFTWLWLHTVGLDGVVLASRALYAVLAVLVAALAYRALAPGVGAAPAAAAAAVPLLAPVYNLLVISYNTVPVLGQVLAVAAGYAALTRPPGDPRVRAWAGTCGAALAVAVLANPLLVGAGGVLALSVVALARRRAVIVPFSGGLALVAVPFLGWLLLVAGPDALRATLDLSAAYRPTGTAATRLGNQWHLLDLFLGTRRFLPLLVLAAAAVVGYAVRLPPRVGATVLALLPVAALWPSLTLLGATRRPPAFGATPAVALVVLVLALVIPVTVAVLRSRRTDLALLLALGVPAAGLGLPAVAAQTLSSPAWGAAAVGAAGAATALIAAWAALIAALWRPVPQLAALALVVAFAAMLTVTPFRDPPPWALPGRVGDGAFAGTRTTASSVASLAAIGGAARRWVPPGASLLCYGIPGGYLLVDATVASNITWLVDWGGANRATLDWFDRTGRRPDVVLVDSGLARQEGGLGALATRDPLIEYLLAGYDVVEPGLAGPIVLRRR